MAAIRAIYKNKDLGALNSDYAPSANNSNGKITTDNASDDEEPIISRRVIKKAKSVKDLKKKKTTGAAQKIADNVPATVTKRVQEPASDSEDDLPLAAKRIRKAAVGTAVAKSVTKSVTKPKSALAEQALW